MDWLHLLSGTFSVRLAGHANRTVEQQLPRLARRAEFRYSETQVFALRPSSVIFGDTALGRVLPVICSVQAFARSADCYPHAQTEAINARSHPAGLSPDRSRACGARFDGWLLQYGQPATIAHVHYRVLYFGTDAACYAVTYTRNEYSPPSPDAEEFEDNFCGS